MDSIGGESRFLRTIRRFALAGLVVIALSACATHYATPTEGDVANLKVLSHGMKFTLSWTPTGWSYTATQIGELDESGCVDNERMNPVSGDVIANDGTMTVTADKDLIISVSSNRGDLHCAVGAIVRFAKDKNYVLDYRFHSQFPYYSGHCTLAFAERTKGILMPTRLYEFESPGEGKLCKVEGGIDRKLFACSSAAAGLSFSGTSCSTRVVLKKGRIKCIPDVGCRCE